MEDVTNSSSIDKAYVAAYALSGLTRTIYHCFFENEKKLYDHHVLDILISSFNAYSELHFGNLTQEYILINLSKDSDNPDWGKLQIEESFYQFLILF